LTKENVMTTAHSEKNLLITGARVYTADPDFPWAEAILTSGNRIQYVGNQSEARARASSRVEQIHIPGGLVLPGLNDSHIHMTPGSYALTILNLEGTATWIELQDRLRRYAAEHPEREWIEGYGLPYEPLTGLERPEREILDEAIPNRPVFIRAFDAHSAWANTEALRRAGIERGATIARPNEVVVDPQTGMATGMLKERLAYGLVMQHIPEPTVAEKDGMLREAMRYLNRLGITSVQNMDADKERLEQYARLYERGESSIRAAHYLSANEATTIAQLHDFAQLAQRYQDAWNHVCGIKLFIDGVVESKTALMLEPYADGCGDVGVPNLDPPFYREIVAVADELGMNVATHAIGDGGIRLALDTYEYAQQRNGERPQRRHRIEHIEVIHPTDIARFGQRGVTASMQPFHAAPTTDPRTTLWTRLVGPAREPYAFVWRRLLETGAHLAFGSDWPVVTPDVRVGLHTAVTRQNVAREPPGGWQPQLAVTLAQALDAYTAGAARAEGQEKYKGRLRPGMLADITAFAEDLFAIPPSAFPQVEVVLTVVDGQIVHRSC
jgi:predicted amidohydrolase YtcJ